MVSKIQVTIFDLDDTLVRTDARTTVTHEDGTTDSLAPAEYANYVRQKGDKFDYSGFRTLVNPQFIERGLELFKQAYVLDRETSDVVILTARAGDLTYLRDFFSENGFYDVQIVGMIDEMDIARFKADWISSYVERHKPQMVTFIDDCCKNVRAIDDLAKQFPKCKFITRLFE